MSYTTATLSELEDLCDSDNFRIIDVREGKCYDTDSSCSRDNYRSCDRSEYSGRCERRRPCDPGVFVFASVLTPLCDIRPKSTVREGCVEFQMRRKNKTVTFQWEPFSAIMAASGVTHISVNQGICNLPPYAMTFPMMLHYKNHRRMTYMEINPHRDRSQIRIYLNVNGSSDGVHQGDAIFVPGGSITWIVE